jgi:hypothetical protein
MDIFQVQPSGTTPCLHTRIRNRFGSWLAFKLALAEATGLDPGHRGHTTLAECLTAGLSFVADYGYLPGLRDWDAAGMYPGRSAAQYHFGSWSAFKVALAEAIEQRERRHPYPGCLRALRELREARERREAA